MAKSSGSYTKGHIGYWRGKVSPQRTGKYKTCPVCGIEFYVAKWQEKIGEGRYCSRKCYQTLPISDTHRKHLSESHKGEKSVTWRGGVTDKYYKRLSNYKWKQLRSEIYKRDNYTCRKCNKQLSNKELSCHHIMPYRYCDGDETKCLFWNITVNDKVNLVTLCRHCHAEEDWKFRKSEERGEHGFTPVLTTYSTIWHNLWRYQGYVRITRMVACKRTSILYQCYL